MKRILLIVVFMLAPMGLNSPAQEKGGVGERGPVKIEYETRTYSYPVTEMRTVEYKIPKLYREYVVREEVLPQPPRSQMLSSGTLRTVVYDAVPRKQAVYMEQPPQPTRAYTPVVGVRGMTVAYHLKNSPHFIDPVYVDSLTIDQQYRLHDALHGQTRNRTRTVNKSRSVVRPRFFPILRRRR